MTDLREKIEGLQKDVERHLANIEAEKEVVRKLNKTIKKLTTVSESIENIFKEVNEETAVSL